jgi:hypothetical protein
MIYIPAANPDFCGRNPNLIKQRPPAGYIKVIKDGKSGKKGRKKQRKKVKKTAKNLKISLQNTGKRY